MKTYTINEVKDTFIGEPGTPERTKYEAKLESETTFRLTEIDGEVFKLSDSQISTLKKEASRMQSANHFGVTKTF